MGIALDTSIVVQAERQRRTPKGFIQDLEKRVGSEGFVLPSICAMELTHGIWRADSRERRDFREAWLEAIFASIEVSPFTLRTARIAGRIDGETKSPGVTIPGNDLLIGATALELGFALFTANPRHFRLIPDLDVISV